MGSDEFARHIAEENQDNLRELVSQLDTPLGVIPFVGAGMSADFGFKPWGEFLKKRAAAAVVGPEVKKLLSRGLYEEAAELVMDRVGRGAFQDAMKSEFGDHKLEGGRAAGAVALLPKLAKRQVITTNFDHVLEWVFRRAGPELDFREVIWGARTQAVNEALNRGLRVLIKIHGDVRESADRILTKSEYDRHYGPADPENISSTPLTGIMRVLLTRPLLFLGCSLEKDRIVAMLKQLNIELHDALEHFAILAAPSDPGAWVRRCNELGSMGIRPIWYPAGQYGEITKLLADVLGRTSGEAHEAHTAAEADIDAAYWEGIAALKANRYEKAREELGRVAAARPHDQHVRKQLKEAETGCRRAQLESAARAAEDASDWELASKALDELLRLSPNDPVLGGRQARVLRKVELRNLWEETREHFERQNWPAVVESFREMEKLEPGLADSEGWLAEARTRLKQQEIRGLIRVHLREATEQFESGDWAKALSALHRVLELDPDHDSARELYAQVQAKVAKAEAATLLAKRYAKATRAMDAAEWPEAIELLKAVIREDASYRDAAALLERAESELADIRATLDVTLSVKPSPVPPDSNATWRLRVRNAGRVTISSIVAKVQGVGPAEGAPPGEPFSLGPGESRTVSFTTHHTTRGARRHIEVEGTTPAGRAVRAEVKASVNVQKPPPATPSPATTPTPPGAGAAARTPEVIQVSKSDPNGFRRGLRSAKNAASLDDLETHRLIRLLEEGERHYRVSIHSLSRPTGWAARVEAWQEQTALLKLDAVAWVSLGPPAPGAILEHMRRLAREIRRRLGVDIPVGDLEAMAQGGV